MKVQTVEFSRTRRFHIVNVEITPQEWVRCGTPSSSLDETGVASAKIFHANLAAMRAESSR